MDGQCPKTILGDFSQSINPYSPYTLEDLHQLAPKAACGFCDGCFTERYPVDLE